MSAKIINEVSRQIIKKTITNTTYRNSIRMIKSKQIRSWILDAQFTRQDLQAVLK